MAKKDKGKVVQMLSPENYIRQRARSLPLFECTVNTEWETSKMALLTIARRHSNGNITNSMFMVDLLCQGVKESHFQFNIPMNEYRENQVKQSELMDFKPIDYNLAHNIIYAALAFAEDYEFKPHKVFTSTTRFMLEEDTDNIPLIDIECGLEGKPAIVLGLTDDDKADQQIIAHLEKVVGPGNFIILSGPDDLDDFDLEDNGDFEKDLQAELEENIKEFTKLFNKTENQNKVDFKRYLELAISLFNRLTDDSEFDDYFDKLDFLLDIKLDNKAVSNEMLGIIDDHDELRHLFSEIFYMAFTFDSKLQKEWKTYQAKAPNQPSTCFLELIILKLYSESGTSSEKITEYYERFPDYKLISMTYFGYLISYFHVEDNDIVWMKIEEIGKNIRQKMQLHEIELFVYVLLLISVYFDSENPSKINALHAIVDELEINITLRLYLQTLISIQKAFLVKDMLTNYYSTDEPDKELL